MSRGCRRCATAAGSPTRPSSTRAASRSASSASRTPDVPSISSPGNVKFLADVAGIVNAEAARLTAAGVNKIILSSHLQNVDSEEALSSSCSNVDIVISGGGDELLANPGDLLVPTSAGRRVVKGAYPLPAKDAAGATVPVVTTQGEYRYVGRLTVDFDARRQPGRRPTPTRSGPVRVVRRRRRTPDYVADEDAALKSQHHRPAGRLQGRCWRRTSSAPPTSRSTAATRTRSASRRANLGNLVADGFLRRRQPHRGRRRPPGGATSRSPTAAASARRSPARATTRTSPRSRRSTCCRSTT